MEDQHTPLFQQAAERVAQIKRKLPQFARDSKQTHNNSSSQLYQKWKHSLDLFEAMLTYADVSAISFLDSNMARAKADDDEVLKVLAYFYNRVHHTVGEIDALMRSGYPAAAFARWRLLYEYSIFAQFITQHGADVARAYQEFRVMDVVDMMRSFRAVSAARPGLKPFDAEEEALYQASEAELQALCAKYQIVERDQLGWTISVFRTGRRTMHRMVRKVEEENSRRGTAPKNLTVICGPSICSRIHWCMQAR